MTKWIKNPLDLLLAIGIWGLFFGIGVFMIVLTVKGTKGFIIRTQNIIEFSESSHVIDGEVRVVRSQSYHEGSRGKVLGNWYTLYEGTIAYTNEQGEEEFFDSDDYKKKLKVGETIELIYDPKDEKSMDIVYFDIFTFRKAPMRYHTSIWTPLLLLVAATMGIICVIFSFWLWIGED